MPAWLPNARAGSDPETAGQPPRAAPFRAAWGRATGPGPTADTLDCLVDELQLSIRYHQSLFPGRQVEKLVFLGGEARSSRPARKSPGALRIGAQLG